MDLIRIFLTRIASLFNRAKRDRDLEEELRSHIDLATAENMTRGMSRKEARRNVAVYSTAHHGLFERPVG